MNLQKLIGEPNLTEEEAKSELVKKIATFGIGMGLLAAVTYADIATGFTNQHEEIASGILKALIGGFTISYLIGPRYSHNGAGFFG